MIAGPAGPHGGLRVATSWTGVEAAASSRMLPLGVTARLEFCRHMAQT